MGEIPFLGSMVLKSPTSAAGSWAKAEREIKAKNVKMRFMDDPNKTRPS